MIQGFPRRHRLTVDEYSRMGEAGVLRADARFELIDGEIHDMPPIGSRHAAVIERSDDFLVPRLRGRAMVRVQHPIVLDQNSMPQPDIAVVVPATTTTSRPIRVRKTCCSSSKYRMRRFRSTAK